MLAVNALLIASLMGLPSFSAVGQSPEATVQIASADDDAKKEEAKKEKAEKGQDRREERRDDKKKDDDNQGKEESDAKPADSGANEKAIGGDRGEF